ncbi:MAG: hypothetical protein V4696_08880 [Pseudomonadota bacterium]
MPSETAVKSFIVSTFRSVWAIDLLRVLLATPDRALTTAGLIEQLRASESVVAQSVESLSAAGMVIADGDLVRLREFDPDTHGLLEAAIDLYRISPDKVRRLIVAQSLPGATAFSDAFRLWKD